MSDPEGSENEKMTQEPEQVIRSAQQGSQPPSAMSVTYNDTLADGIMKIFKKKTNIKGIVRNLTDDTNDSMEMEGKTKDEKKVGFLEPEKMESIAITVNADPLIRKMFRKEFGYEEDTVQIRTITIDEGDLESSSTDETESSSSNEKIASTERKLPGIKRYLQKKESPRSQTPCRIEDIYERYSDKEKNVYSIQVSPNLRGSSDNKKEDNSNEDSRESKKYTPPNEYKSGDKPAYETKNIYTNPSKDNNKYVSENESKNTWQEFGNGRNLDSKSDHKISDNSTPEARNISEDTSHRNVGTVSRDQSKLGGRSAYVTKNIKEDEGSKLDSENDSKINDNHKYASKDTYNNISYEKNDYKDKKTTVNFVNENDNISEINNVYDKMLDRQNNSKIKENSSVHRKDTRRRCECRRKNDDDESIKVCDCRRKRRNSEKDETQENSDLDFCAPPPP